MYLLDTGVRLGGEAQPVMVEGFSGATQVVQLLLSWVDGGQSTKRYPLEDVVSDDDSSDEVHVMTSIDYYYQLLESEEMGDSPKNESDALDPEKRFREWHMFDETRYSKY
ncbi:hypothetical protein T12_16625 [Trichinella patagoniensis]|uniref:Uncharacterized protein n=1 Tax=Trichinella patagoniensis TaxID=990121 RepID=A0A0V0Z3U6_9BILA|nr:hypothetical protein T12_16625 [Trichinella patagoniensis]